MSTLYYDILCIYYVYSSIPQKLGKYVMWLVMASTVLLMSDESYWWLLMVVGGDDNDGDDDDCDDDGDDDDVVVCTGQYCSYLWLIKVIDG